MAVRDILDCFHLNVFFSLNAINLGARVGTFSPVHDSDTKLCCGGQAVSSVSPLGMKHPSLELSLTWRAPTLQERVLASNAGTPIPTGPVVIKATMKRDPLSATNDDTGDDPGLVQVSYSLTEVEAPKKGKLLTEMSQKTQKEEKTYKTDIVASHQVCQRTNFESNRAQGSRRLVSLVCPPHVHVRWLSLAFVQLFIDFVRNRDVFSAGTLLGDRVHMILDSRDIYGRDKVFHSLLALHVPHCVSQSPIPDAFFIFSLHCRVVIT